MFFKSLCFHEVKLWKAVYNSIDLYTDYCFDYIGLISLILKKYV